MDILRGIRDDDDLLAAAYLFCVWNQLKNPKEWLTKHFGKQVCELVANLKVVIDVSEKARSREGEARISQQPDAVRRLLLALCTDLRLVVLRLASRLQRCAISQRPKLRVQKNTVPKLWRFTLRLPTV